jgi:pimeloyl-ACP methyl ester carboxylesterase
VRRGWKILIALLALLAALLIVNTIVVDNQTKPAGVNVTGGRILHLPGGDAQVVQTGPRIRKGVGQPIVLVHCYGCSLHWWDRLTPLLAKNHQVTRIDLLGFGGSEKPSGGYSMEDQAGLVASALNKLGIQGAMVVGHSMGFDVTTALAKQSSELVDRAVDIDEGPDSSYGEGLPILAKLAYIPVVGEALQRITPDVAIRDSYDVAFAPGYDVPEAFSDQIVDGFRAMTYTSFDQSSSAENDYSDAEPLDARIRDAAVPLLVIFGSEDQLWKDPSEAAQAYDDVPGAEIQMIEGAGHSPNVEKPVETAQLILKFASTATVPPPSPTRAGGRPSRSHRGSGAHRGGGRGGHGSRRAHGHKGSK